MNWGCSWRQQDGDEAGTVADQNAAGALGFRGEAFGDAQAIGVVGMHGEDPGQGLAAGVGAQEYITQRRSSPFLICWLGLGQYDFATGEWADDKSFSSSGSASSAVFLKVSWKSDGRDWRKTDALPCARRLQAC